MVVVVGAEVVVVVGAVVEVVEVVEVLDVVELVEVVELVLDMLDMDDVVGVGVELVVVDDEVGDAAWSGVAQVETIRPIAAADVHTRGLTDQYTQPRVNRFSDIIEPMIGPGLGYRIPMADTFPGKLILADGAIVDVDLTLNGETLDLMASGALVGSWPIKHCRVGPGPPGEFRLVLDDEHVRFQPSDSTRFGKVAARTFHASSLSDRIAVVRELPVEVPDAEPVASLALRMPSDMRAALAVTAIVVGVGILLLLAGMALFRDREAPPITAAAAPTPTVTVASLPAVFDQTPDEFVAAWNQAAGRLSVPILIRSSVGAGPFEVPLADQLTISGDVTAEGTISSITISADPTGEGDDTVIAAWGVAMAVVDPTLDGNQRRDLLASLGFDLNMADLAGLDSEVELNGTRYSLRYLEEFSTVLFAITPARGS